MSILGNILGKIFGKKKPAAEAGAKGKFRKGR